VKAISAQLIDALNRRAEAIAEMDEIGQIDHCEIEVEDADGLRRSMCEGNKMPVCYRRIAVAVGQRDDGSSSWHAAGPAFPSTIQGDAVGGELRRSQQAKLRGHLPTIVYSNPLPAGGNVPTSPVVRLVESVTETGTTRGAR